MKGLLTLVISPLLFSAAAFAAEGPICTEAGQDTWMPENDFITMATSLGYESDGFTVTSGNCYALTKVEGESGELDYFNPVTGVIVE